MTDRFAALRNLPRCGFNTAARPTVDEPVQPAVVQPAVPAVVQRPKKTKPNESCHCGSHIKYKKCCMHKDSNSSTPSPVAQLQAMMRKDKTFAANMRKMSELLVPSAAAAKF